MRALTYDGNRTRVVSPPPWVSVRPGEDGVLCECARCEMTELVGGERAEAERRLGRFASWHARCADRSLFPAPRPPREEPPPPLTYVRRRAG